MADRHRGHLERAALDAVLEPGGLAEPAVHDHRVGPSQRVAAVVGEVAPRLHGVPLGGGVDPLRALAVEPARRDAEPELRDRAVAGQPVPDVAAKPAAQGHVGLVHRRTPLIGCLRSTETLVTHADGGATSARSPWTTAHLVADVESPWLTTRLVDHGGVRVRPAQRAQGPR